jgi:formyl-CoA transferase
MNSYEAILEALRCAQAVARSFRSVRCDGGLDDGAAAAIRRRHTTQRMGLAHTSISPYGAFRSRDGVDILISIRNDREWCVLAERDG